MYWTGLLYVLDWYVVCTGLICCIYWTGVLYVLDWCVAEGYQNISGGYEAGSCSGGRGT